MSIPGPPTGGGLEVRGLSHSFTTRTGRKQVLTDVGFTVQDGEFVALMGPSGCGKTTVLNMVAGFIQADAGSIRCAGTQVTGPGADRGVVFQRPTLYPWLSVLDNVMFGPRARGVSDAAAKTQARDLLNEVGLGEYIDAKPYELSGGMQSRAAIVRTLINEPRLLLMDEPFAALDAHTRVEMQNQLLQIWQRHQSTVLFVTHDIEEGLLLADRVLVLGKSPSAVVAEFRVPLERPRTYDDVLHMDFVALRQEVRKVIIAAQGVRPRD